MHTHINTGDKATRSAEQMRKVGTPVNTGKYGHHPDEMAQMYRRLNMMAVIFDVDQETTTGVRISNAETAGWVKKYPDTFVGFGSVDPWKGNAAANEVKRCADMGLRGMKFQQATQAFCPTNTRFFPIYEACNRLNLPVIFHGGTTAISAGTPGGRGLVCWSRTRCSSAPTSRSCRPSAGSPSSRPCRSRSRCGPRYCCTAKFLDIKLQ